MTTAGEKTGRIQLLSDTLAKAKSEDRAALVAYLPAGFPTVDGAIEAVKAVIEGGADIVEIGLPHSDPVLDGAIIQTADDIALRGGVKIADVIRTVREAHEATGAPVLVMTYWNPIDRYGVERFTAELAAAGGSRLHPARPAGAGVRAVARARREARSGDRLRRGPEQQGRAPGHHHGGLPGFVYAASLMGVTGTRESVGNQAADLVRRTRATSDLPVCVGLGVSNAVQAKEVAGFADGVIVGSAFVKLLLDAPDLPAGLDAVRSLAGELAEGVRRS